MELSHISYGFKQFSQKMQQKRLSIFFFVAAFAKKSMNSLKYCYAPINAKKLF